jgi:hypothetical protein
VSPPQIAFGVYLWVGSSLMVGYALLVLVAGSRPRFAHLVFLSLLWPVVLALVSRNVSKEREAYTAWVQRAKESGQTIQ